MDYTEGYLTAAGDISYNRWAEGVTVYRAHWRAEPVGEHGLFWSAIPDSDPIAKGETVRAGEMVWIELDHVRT